MGAVPLAGRAGMPRQTLGTKANQFGTWLGDLVNGPKPLETRPGPGLAGDATDATIQAARSGEILRARQSRGRAGSYLTGPDGVTSPPPIATKKLTGS